MAAVRELMRESKAAMESENARLREQVARLKAERAAARAAARAAPAAPAVDGSSLERKCGWCKETFVTQSLAGKYCSVRCRVAAHRAAKQATA